jgi:hypothetical protein
MELTEEQKQRILAEEKQRLAEEQFRAHVREQLAQEQTPPISANQTHVSIGSEGHKNHPFLKVLLSASACIVALIIVVNLIPRSSLSPSTSKTDSSPSIMYVQEQQPVSSGSFQIAPLGISSLRIVVTPEMRQARLVGRFGVSGGMGNDIEAGITASESEHLNYINGHQARGVWFAPGQVTSETFDVSVPPGTYYLDLSNKFSILAAKTVSLDVSISYQRLRFR